MNIPFLNILFAAVNIIEPAITDDDTAAAPVITLHTRDIDMSEITDLGQLENTRVLYRHFTDRAPITGMIVGAKTTGRTTELLVQPDAGHDARYAKWVHVTDAKYAWYQAVSK